VGVRVDETGEHDLAADVQVLGRLVECAKLVHGPDCHDARAVDCDRAIGNDAAIRIHRDDRAAPDEETDRCPGLSAERHDEQGRQRRQAERDAEETNRAHGR
jgi:hypothetical protein